MEEPKEIIVKMPNWIGDLIMATPVLADLHQKWPEAHITAMCQSSLSPILKYDPNVTELLSYQKPSGWIHHQSHWKIINTLRRERYDLGLLLTNSFSSAWWFFLGGVKNRIGYAADFRSWLLNKAVPYPKNKEKQHLVTTYKMLLNSIDIPLTTNEPRLYITPEEIEASHRLLEHCGINRRIHRLIGINPGAAYGSAKCWPPERFRAVTEKLLEDPNLYIIYFGDGSGAPLVNAICEGLPSRVINMAGKTTLRELLALINVCDLLLTNDSGPMHIAAALKIPLVAIFGSTSEIKTGPYGIGEVIHKHVECSPCYKKVCPIDFRCMKRISVEEVYEAILRNLQKFSKNKDTNKEI